jgi:hypothetical protein
MQAATVGRQRAQRSGVFPASSVVPSMPMTTSFFSIAAPLLFLFLDYFLNDIPQDKKKTSPRSSSKISKTGIMLISKKK